MKICALCKSRLLPATPIVEIVGGLLDPEDPEFFVIDEQVMMTSHIHRECLLRKLQEA
jgi:hypothetical protein